jgi:hypothetical protein
LRKHSSGVIIGTVVSIILGFCIVAGVWLSLSSVQGLGYEPNVLRATKTGPNSASLNLSTYPDSYVCHPGTGEPQIEWVSYCDSTTFEVPANSTITVTISNYDSASGLINDYFQQVRGTIGGVEVVNNKPMSQVNMDDVAHTFTLQSTPNSTQPIFVSVPLLGVADNAPTPINRAGQSYPNPVVSTFKFQTGGNETYIWHCYVPCGSDRGVPYGFSGPMSTTGYMAGTLTVANY